MGEGLVSDQAGWEQALAAALDDEPADGGPATRPCSCGVVGRYSRPGIVNTALCVNPKCKVIAYYCSR